MPSHFLAAGVYGCVYHPGYTCKGKSMRRKQWVTKLTYQNEITQNEIEVGKILKGCPDFVLVEESCPIPYKALEQMKEGCELVKKGKKYILLYSKYIPSKEIGHVLHADTPFSRMFRCFYQLCDLVSVLIDHKIIHHDLHFGNILYTDTAKLMLIDFGLSIRADQLDQPVYLREIFSSYMPQWFWYPVEIHILSFCVNYGVLTYEGLQKMLDLYVDNPIFKSFSALRNYRERCVEVFSPYVGSDPSAYLCQFWHTWDYYDTALRFLYVTQQKQIPEFEPILLSMIHPDPSKRPSAIELRSQNQHMIQSMELNRVSKIDSFVKESMLI